MTGSIAFTAAARAVYLVVADQDDAKRRLLLPIKNNLGDDSTGLAYRIQVRPGVLEAPFIYWEPEPVTVSADEVMNSEGSGHTALDDAIEWLEDALAYEAVGVKELQKEARDAGHAWATVRRARDRLGVTSEKAGFTGGWKWRLAKGAQALEPLNDERLSTFAGGREFTGVSEGENTENAKVLKPEPLRGEHPCPRCRGEGCGWCKR